MRPPKRTAIEQHRARREAGISEHVEQMRVALRGSPMAYTAAVARAATAFIANPNDVTLAGLVSAAAACNAEVKKDKRKMAWKED